MSASAPAAEPTPRCRADSQRLDIPGEDVIVGDAAIGPGGLLLGLLRVDGGRRRASVMQVSLDLSRSHVVDVGPALGDDPPPSPRWRGATPYVAFVTRPSVDGGSPLRALRVAPVQGEALGLVEATIAQQADESTAFDLAWSEDGPGLVAWDEDAPSNGDASPSAMALRGSVKVQGLPTPGSGGDGAPRHVASPETSDADQPRLLPRPGGFWLAWLARRAEDDVPGVEGPGDKRAFRWVEVVALDAKGEAVGAVRRVSPERGRAATFELARSGADLVVMVQDESAPSEGTGGRIVRYLVGERVEASEIVGSGVGQSLVELAPAEASTDAARWLAWSDIAERAHVAPLSPALVAAGRSSSEPALDGARVLAAARPGTLYALVGAGGERSSEGQQPAPQRPELRRFVCQ